MYLNKEICTNCEGECCKGSGCMLSTRDVKGDIENSLKKLIENRAITIYSMPTNFFMLYAFESIITHLVISPAVEKLSERARALRKYSNVFLIKMRSVNQDVFYEIQDVNRISDFAFSGKCIFLNSKGCDYSDEERPYGGKQLKPDKRGIKYCKSDFTVLDAALEWLPYHSTLDNLWKMK